MNKIWIDAWFAWMFPDLHRMSIARQIVIKENKKDKEEYE